MGGGVRVFFSFDLLKGDGRGKRLIFLQNSLLEGGGGWGGVGFTNSILAKLN
jgi:hypothetical protein